MVFDSTGVENMTDLAILLGLAFMTVCVAFSTLHSMRLGRLTLIDWTFLSMAGIYGGGWVLVAFVTKQGGNPTWSAWLLPFENLYPIHTLSSLILASFMLVGWWLLGSRLRLQNQQERLRPLKSVEARLLTMMWLLLFIAFLTQWLYSQAYGGFIGMLEYSSLIRASIFGEVPSNLFSFLKPFGGLAIFASFGFFGLWLCKRRRAGVLIGLVFSIMFSIYLLYSWLGRIGFLVYLATFILGVILYRRPHPLILLVKGATTMFAILAGSYYVSVWLNLKSADNFLVFLTRELSFPFGSFFAQLDLGDHLFRGFKDFFVSPIYLLPSSWWSEWVVNISQINTNVIMGAPKGEQGVTGGIPVDLLTLGLMQASVFGVAVVGLMFGILLRFIQSLLDRLPHAGVRAVFEAYVTLNIAVLGVFYAQPELFISSNFALLVTVLVLIAFLKIPKFRWFTTRCQPPARYACGIDEGHVPSGSQTK